MLIIAFFARNTTVGATIATAEVIVVETVDIATIIAAGTIGATGAVAAAGDTIGIGELDCLFRRHFAFLQSGLPLRVNIV